MNSVADVAQSPEAASILTVMPTLDHFSLWCNGYYLFETANSNNPLEMIGTLVLLCSGKAGAYQLKLREKHRSAEGIQRIICWGLSINKKFRTFDMKMNGDWMTTSGPWTVTITL
jgi:hypothetical protein